MCSWPIQVNSVGTPPCALPFLFSSYCSDETQRKDTFLKEVGRQRGRNKTNQETRCEKQEGFICVAYLFFVVFVFRCFCCFGFSVHPFCCDLVCFFYKASISSSSSSTAAPLAEADFFSAASSCGSSPEPSSSSSSPSSSDSSSASL